MLEAVAVPPSLLGVGVVGPTGSGAAFRAVESSAPVEIEVEVLTTCGMVARWVRSCNPDH